MTWKPVDEHVEEVGLMKLDGVPVARMIELFGEANAGFDDYKSDVAWNLSNGAHSVHVYNWKDGPNYNGSEVEFADVSYYSVRGGVDAMSTFIDYVREVI